jgi:hypothetical protein
METLTAITNEALIAKILALKEQARRAHYWTSHVPDQRAEQFVTGATEEIIKAVKTLRTANVDEEQINRFVATYITKTTDWLSAKSRCMSSMITGPAKFPVARAEKANRAERQRSDDLYNWFNKALHKLTTGPSDNIVKGTAGALEAMEAKLAKEVEAHELMKAINKVLRAKITDPDELATELADIGCGEKLISSILAEGPAMKPFTFELTNGNQRINNLRKDIEAEKARAEQYADGDKQYTINGVDVCECVADNRIRLTFDSKPEPDMIAKLKRNGFKWSPKAGAWQRQLTRAAVSATEQILK